MKTPAPVTLEGKHVILRPMQESDIPELSRVGLAEDLWRLSLNVLRTPEDMAAYVRAALQAQEAGTALPFVYVHPETGELMGSTRFGNMDLANKGLEIGWTWVIPAWQRTGVNTEAKYLLLRHAFEELGCIRVALKTDVLNERSRQAMRRIGAREEGILRNHLITSEGRVRDSVMLSILDREWPQVKARLEGMLQRQG
ncbi:GNAT family N-acetyltransferase [Rufibacter sediminis]|uniref:GNAT family N-acetyltransferase n=1 Tax=Rufibacter sediminis TaxID=2762756 RepID=A0ABR6VPZ2_9BACT|nr:GNAT family protein [Rufibacter sediminis]MBC3539266.1 GNAT family N-acetyltransferase [Rufibacter sediminis]